MMNRSDLHHLGEFIKSPNLRNASMLVGIPSLIEVLNLKSAPYSPELLGLCKWMHTVGKMVLKMLFRGQKEDAVDDIINDSVSEEDWRKVRTLTLKYNNTHGLIIRS